MRTLVSMFLRGLENHDKLSLDSQVTFRESNPGHPEYGKEALIPMPQCSMRK
jgi:hypothetical protein